MESQPARPNRFGARNALRLGAALLAALSLTGRPTQAQADPAAEADQDMRAGMVHIIEGFLFNVTQKTTTVVYAKQLQFNEDQLLICGAAMFGSKPQAFILNTSTNVFIREPKRAQWVSEGCDGAGFKTLIDLR